MTMLSDFGPLLLSVGSFALLLQFLQLNARIVRPLCSALCIFVSIRYWWWRLEWSMPSQQNLLQEAWAWLYFVFESMAIVSSILGFIFMARRSLRAPPATVAHELLSAPVDVFIATYNEPFEVLERTIVGAAAIEHSDLRVWVLDDGAREWVRKLALELGAHYVQRVKGAHAKAGNVNNGLRHALSTGRRPEFILLLDADFIPFRNILRRTLGLFAEADVGIVQTPQHFFNPDPIQSNLLCAELWPDEQRFFFDTLLPSKDAWGAAFCCGTSAVFRVEAMVSAGGMAVETVTEDMLTTFKFAEYGYRTVLLNEMLSMGLAPEELSAYISQRARWCLGAIQQIYTRWSFAGRARISLVNRLSAFDGVLYWIGGAPFKLLIISSPLVFWWTQTAVISATLSDLTCYLAPVVACSTIFMFYFAEKRVMPLMSDVSQLLTSFAVIATVAGGLVKPWGRPFKVTLKGISSDKVTVHWNLMMPFAVLSLATVLGMATHISQYSPLHGTAGFQINVLWSLFNVLVLMVTCAVCVELPRRRKEERFSSSEAALLRLTTGMQVPCVVRDISLSGAHIELPIGQLRSSDNGVLLFSDGVEVPFEQVRNLPGGLALRFGNESEARRRLIVKIFTGRYANKVATIQLTRVLAAVGKRLAA